MFDDSNNKTNKLVVSLGFFSVVRIERPAQFLINAVEYCVPDKECVVAEENDPCKLFRNMAFPVNEFSPGSIHQVGPCDGGVSERSDCKRCGN